jgi:stage II sporulation protein P
MDYPTTISKFNYAYSYKYSKQTVVDALSENKELTYLLDIHRDSLKRNKTTVEINGKSYAKILFVIGEKNPNWKDNKAFATQLHESLNAKFPGISRGVLTKAPGTGNAEYNQSLSKNSLVVEMGGVDNTLEESYRTADALAAILHELDQNGKV